MYLPSVTHEYSYQRITVFHCVCVCVLLHNLAWYYDSCFETSDVKLSNVNLKELWNIAGIMIQTSDQFCVHCRL